VVGYSRLTEIDEEGTIARLKKLREELFEPLVANHRGRLVKLMGDGALVEFASAVDAVRCAVETQRLASARNMELPADQRIELRIGVNLGDIVIDGDDILGDGVNVAARLEGIAEPAGVCVSAKVHDEVRGKVDVVFDDLGSVQVKNIAQPIRVYRARINRGGRSKAPPVRLRRKHLVAVATTVLAGAIAILVGGYYLASSDRGIVSRKAGPQSISSLSDKPSIAVLAFQNMSDDPSQEYFADGIAEDIITDLSKLSGLYVIARNSSFQYKGQNVDVKRIGRDLGVKHVLEGSVRRAGDQVRITAQLVDAETGSHIWAERYDGTLSDVFSVQDRVSGQIIGALKVQLTPTERREVDAHATEEPAAYDAYLRGLKLLAELKRIDVSANSAAQLEFAEAIRLDPNFALAYAGLAWAKWLYATTIAIPLEPADQIFELAESSIALRDNALAHRTLSKQHFSLDTWFARTTGQLDLAVAELEAAQRLQPTDPDILADLATVLSFVGRPDEALTLIQRAVQLNPNHPDWYFLASGIALLLTQNPTPAAEHLRKWSEINPSWHVPYIFLAAALANAGNQDGAKEALARFDELYYRGSTKTLRFVRYSWPMAAEQEKIFLRGLRSAGMPE